MKEKKLLNNLSIRTIVFFSLTGLFLAFNSFKRDLVKEDIPSLKNVFKKDFLIGTALSANQIQQKDPAADALIQQQFNAITSENIMKCEVINPQWGIYNFDLADKFVEYGKKYNMQVIAHNLIWHSQL